jgi:CMP-2-keto-3-deoxyoctulosonic acid synthetase
MNSKTLLAIAALAVVASTGARADEADASQYAVKFEGNRTRAEVQAEAANVAATRSTEPNGSRVAAPLKSTVDSRVLRAQAAEAVRLGQISYGEVGRI